MRLLITFVPVKPILSLDEQSKIVDEYAGLFPVPVSTSNTITYFVPTFSEFSRIEIIEL